ADEHLVVVAYRELTPRERPPGRGAHPRRHVAEVPPAAVRLVARRVVDLRDRLRPRAARRRGRQPLLRPRLVPAVCEELAVLVAPVLAPVLGDERALDRAVGVSQEHHEEVLELDASRLVADDVDVLRAPRLVGAVWGETRPEADDLQEVEARAERAG